MKRRRRAVLITAAVVLVCALVALGVGFLGRNAPPQNEGARQDDEADPFVITLNVNEKGEVLLWSPDSVGTANVLTNPDQVRSYVQTLHEEDMKLMQPEDKAKGPRLRVVIRADERAKAEDVNEIAEACRKAGFPDPTIIRVRKV